MHWHVVSWQKYNDFLFYRDESFEQSLYSDRYFRDTVVAGYRFCVYSQHLGCQCQRQVLLRAAHPAEELWPLPWPFLQNALCEFLEQNGLPIPDPFPAVEPGYWWEDPESRDNIYQAWMLAWMGATDDVLYRE